MGYKDQEKTEGRETSATRTVYHQVCQYVADIPYSKLEQVFEPISRSSDFMIVISGYNVGDAWARLSDSFRECDVPERFCEYESIVYQLAILVNKRVRELHYRRRRL